MAQGPNRVRAKSFFILGLGFGLDIPYNKNRAALQSRGFGSSTGRHSGRTQVSRSSGAGLLLLLTSVHRRQEVRQGGDIIRPGVGNGGGRMGAEVRIRGLKV